MASVRGEGGQYLTRRNWVMLGQQVKVSIKRSPVLKEENKEEKKKEKKEEKKEGKKEKKKEEEEEEEKVEEEEEEKDGDGEEQDPEEEVHFQNTLYPLLLYTQ